MSDPCCAPGDSGGIEQSSAERRILWVALIINATMFAVELGAGAHAGSSAVQADSLDFLADALNYGISLLVVGASLASRSKAALIKGFSMTGLGVWLLLLTGVRFVRGDVPQAEIMGVVGVLAIIANFAVLRLLIAFRTGDANRRAVWICTRNDVIGNIAVLLAAAGVWVVGANWPDALIASGMAVLGLWSGAQITTSALSERNDSRELPVGRRG